VFGPVTLDQYYSCSDISGIENAVIRAADGMVDFRQYNRIYAVIPNDGTCNYSGLSSVGCMQLNSSGDGNFAASFSWLTDSALGNGYGAQLVAHEGGHALGLDHAKYVSFSNEMLGPIGSIGTVSEYGDNWDAMGSWNWGHYSAPHKKMLGWISEGSGVQTIQANGQYSVRPMSAAGTNAVALKIRRGTGNEKWIWLEYRQPIGNFESTINPAAFKGAILHYDEGYPYDLASYLLNVSADNSTLNGFPLLPGNSWKDPYSDLTLSVISASSSALVVNVNYAGSGPTPICTHANPTVSVAPSNPSVDAGGSASYTLNISNQDSSVCPASVFSLRAIIPTGWSSSFSSVSLSLSPGQSGSAVLSVNIPSGASAGTYPIQVIAESGSYVGSASAYCSVLTNPSPTPNPTPIPPPPTGGFTLSVTSTSISVSLSWNSVSGATQYNLYRDGGYFASLLSNTLDDYNIVAGVTYRYEVRAQNSTGEFSTSNSVSVTVGSPNPTPNPTPTPTPPGDTQAPQVSITSPQNGGFVAGRSVVTISALASDNVGIVKVDMYVNGSLICSSQSAPYQCAWKVPKQSGRRYSIQAIAIDQAGNQGQSNPVNVTSN
jgi:chitodextrinase